MQKAIEYSQVDFKARCLRRLKYRLICDLPELCKQFCESETNMLKALNGNQVLIGLLQSFKGRRCVFLEYNNIQLIVPIHELH